ncbi:uncharacterized protein LOC129238955 [Anastrepha obliqua]|uniref:uncharacterized protein LOC129238955 n=1 Tax=Anastrepha obliqua TaxID=95512 RepID=UPI00240A20B6|nr:uncharacterized protein LOC129238955 [Anastrepha obliqua]
MEQKQLNFLRISFAALSFLLYLKAATATVPTGVKLRQRTHAFATWNAKLQPPQELRRLPSNALLTPIDQLAESPLRHTHARLTRAANDGEEGVDDDNYDYNNDYNGDILPWNEQQLAVSRRDGNEVEGGVDFQWISDSFGPMWESLIELLKQLVNAVWQFFTADENDDEGSDENGDGTM